MTAHELEPLPFTAVSYDTEGAARATGLSIETLRIATRKKALVAHYYGTKPVFRAVDLDSWIRSLPTESAAQSSAQRRAS